MSSQTLEGIIRVGGENISVRIFSDGGVDINDSVMQQWFDELSESEREDILGPYAGNQIYSLCSTLIKNFGGSIINYDKEEIQDSEANDIIH